MYRLLNKIALLGCIGWLLIEPGPEPLVVMLLTIAGFFRDDIHGIIGKNVLTLTPKNELIRDFSNSKYSFVNPEFINPMILEDLSGWLSDSGDQIVSINITKSNCSNRYFGDVTVNSSDNSYPCVSARHGGGEFTYQYLGCSFTGVHLIRTWDYTGGSGIFCNILMVVLSNDSAIEYHAKQAIKIDRLVVKLVGRVSLGDRYQGEITYRWGMLTIPQCSGLQTIRKNKSRILVF